MTGRIRDTSRDFKTGQIRITLTLDATQPELIDDYMNKQLDITLKEHRERRSRDANAYAWVLIGKLAAKLGTTPAEIYRELIPEVGDNYDVVCVRNKAVDKLRESWSRQGLGWITDVLKSKIPDCTNVVLYYGSSEYDTAQMSRLLDAIIREAKEQNIETATPEELARLKENWK